jgi:hypothetical protein
MQATANKYLTSTLLPQWHLDKAFLETLHKAKAYLWGSATLLCMVGGTWDPNGIDCIVCGADAAQTISDFLRSIGWSEPVKTDVWDTEGLGLGPDDSDLSDKFAATIRGIWLLDRWVPADVGKRRIAIKVWIGDMEAAHKAAEFSCQRVAANARADGTVMFHGRPEHGKTKLLKELETMNNYHRVKAKGFFVEGFD